MVAVDVRDKDQVRGWQAAHIGGFGGIEIDRLVAGLNH